MDYNWISTLGFVIMAISLITFSACWGENTHEDDGIQEQERKNMKDNKCMKREKEYEKNEHKLPE